MKLKLGSIPEILFSLGFALVLGGILVRIDPDYSYKFLSFLNFDLTSKEDLLYLINIIGVIQTFIGGILLTFSGFWIYKKNKI